MTSIGFVGLGVMGGPMAHRLLKAGHTLTGYNRTRSKAEWLIGEGMRWADSPREVAEAADVTFSMVTGPAALREITEGPDGILAGLAPGTIYIDVTTGSPDASRALAAEVAKLGAAMLDAPVSGSVSTLEEGRLSIIVGGDPEVFERALPILKEIGPTVTHVGGNGTAVLMKIAVNLSLAVQMLALSEGVLLAEKGGVARKTAVDVMLNSVIASPMVKYRGPFILQLPDEAWFNVNMMQKDMLLALQAGRDLDVPLPTTAATNEMLTVARAMGYETEDFAVMFRALARMSGLDG
jgi:3-hydroxyisobutyrate dehydrogenase-like beta-hydroxyacid dehydrogenase